MLKWLSYLPTNPLFFCIHIFNMLFAFSTSTTQTMRIIKEIRRYNRPGLAILGGGLIAAVFGTFVLLMKVNKGLKDISYVKNHIR